MHVPMKKLTLTAAAAALALAGTSGASVSAKPAPSKVRVEVITPSRGDNAGIGGRGWIVDLAVDYPSLQAAGFSGLQLTGPATHNNTAPFPGTFSPGRDDRLPGLVVLVSTTSSFSGPGTNLANLFNVTGVTNRDDDVAQVWDHWIVGAPLFGLDTESVLTVAVVDDLDGNGVYDDAPAVVPDANHDGRVDEDDLKQIGIASNVEEVRFRINGSA